jgi:hypothetical protein
MPRWVVLPFPDSLPTFEYSPSRGKSPLCQQNDHLVVLLFKIDCCSCHGSISGRDMSSLSNFVHTCAVEYHTARFVTGMRADALMGQCKFQIQADGRRAKPIHWKSCLIPLMHGYELVCFRCGIPAVVCFVHCFAD